MNANQIYALPSESETQELYSLAGCYYNHVAEAGESSEWVSKPQTRVTIKTVKEFNFDGRRFWRLATVWLDGHPVMVIQNAGREGDDHRERFITDFPRFCELIAHVRSLAAEGLSDVPTINPEADMPGLTEFYGNSLEGVFERYHL